MKLIKCFVSWILSFLPKLAVFIGWLYLFRFKINGKSIAWHVFDIVDNVVAGWHVTDLFILLQIVIVLLSLAVAGIVVLIIYLVLPLVLLRLVNKFCVRMVAARKNTWASYMYDKETKAGQPHKQRMTGDEWLKQRKEWEEMKKQEKQYQKEEEKRWKQQQKDAYEYGGSAYEEQKAKDQEQARKFWEEEARKRGSSYRGSGSSGNNRTYRANNSELQKAMDAFFLDDLNVTQDELKKIRNKLIKSFHPDGSADTEESTLQTQKINRYYDLLKEAIKK